jgi:copper transport protein
VLATAPADVRLLFDDEIRPAGGDQAVDSHGRSVLAGPAKRQGSRAIVIPLKPNLARGPYSVRWRVVSNDGHLISGVMAFAVGAGQPRPVSTLTAGGGVSTGSFLLRLLFFAGVLLAGGAALTGRRLGARTAVVVPAGLVLVAAGGFGLLALEPAADATRFGRVTETAAIVALVGVAAALAAIVIPPLRLAVLAVGALELAAPTLAGHALDPHRLRALVALADFVHVVGAAVWIGGLALLVLGGGRRDRFPPLALAGLVLLGGASIPRALAAFPSFGDLLHTSYGQAVLVKTGVLVVVLAVAWANRRRIASLGLVAELCLLAVVVGAVAVLTDLRPPARAAAAVAEPSRPTPPPRDAVVFAGQNDDVAVGLALSPRGRNVAARVTVLGPDGNGIDGLRVRIGGVDADACPAGCYRVTVPLRRTIPVELEGPKVEPATLRFALPRRWPPPSAGTLLSKVDRTFRDLRSVVVHERLASSSRNRLDTVYHLVAPDRMAYDIAGGPDAIVIGTTRWDRESPKAPWKRSPQERIRQPEPFWASDPRLNARRLDRTHLSFYDPRLPGWFELTIDPRTARLLALRMTAQAHFMRHRYSGFNRPFRIVPPS